MTSVKCPWCETVVYQTSFINCPNCGGNLPLHSGSDPGPPPPSTPRVLPPKFVKRVKYSSNVYTIIGMVFTLALFFTIIFPIIGIILWRKGIRVANEELNPLMNGTATEGTITNITQNFSIKINGRSPFVVEFLFDFQGRKVAGDVGNLFDPSVLMKKPGDKVWVVFLPEHPEQSSIWPPMK